jgi:hypothetical protein
VANISGCVWSKRNDLSVGTTCDNLTL